MMKNRYRIAAMVLCASMLVAGCAGQAETGQESAGAENQQEQAKDKDKDKNKNEKEYQGSLDQIQPAAYNNVDGLNLEPGSYISIIGKAEKGQYWEAVKRGVEQAAADINKALGYEGKDKIKVTFSGPSTADDVDEQVNILDEELARYPVALGIAIADTNACEVQFDLAAESNIPIVAYDTGSDYLGLMATVATNNEAAAREAASKLAEQMEDTGEVLMFVHDSKSEASRIRENSFRSEIEGSHPNLSIVEVFHMDQADKMKQQIADEILAGTYQRMTDEGTEEAEVSADSMTEEDIYAYLKAKHPNVKGIYATNGSAVTAAAEYAAEDKEMAIIGFDADKEERKFLEEGRIDGLIMQNPFGMGYGAVVACGRAALNLGNEAVVDTGYVWVDHENLESDEVQRMLY